MKTERELTQEIKELRRENERLKGQLDAIRTKIGTKSSFFSQVGREFLVPIEVLQGLTRRVRTTVNTVEDAAERRRRTTEELAQVEECTNTLLGLHNCLWDSAVIENGMMKYALEQFRLEDTVNHLLDTLTPALKRKFLDLYVNFDGIREDYLLGDKYKLMKILECILTQAVHCAEYSTTVDLYAEQVVINSKLVNVSFTVRFAGNRISKDFFDRFGFEPREGINVVDDASESAVIKYTVCKYFMDMMDGALYLDTQSEGELSFIFNMPFEYPSEVNEADARRFSHIHALVLSDSATARSENTAMLMQLGISCEDAAIDEEALDRIGMAEEKDLPFNLVVIDDEAEDEEVLKMIREIRNIFGTGIHILVSAADMKASRRKAQEAGADQLLPKDSFQAELYQCLLAFEDRDPDQTEQVPENYHFENKWVLVAEDIPLNMEVVVKLLKRVGINVVCAENGLDAVRIFESKPVDFFDCVLMDIQMPVMDGLEATRRIRASQKEDGATLPIYAMTANALPKDVEAVLDAGMSGHISKPVNVSGLYRILDKVFTDHEADSMGESLKKRAEELMRENDLLRNQAERDPMTHLLNRYAFEKLVLELKSKPTPIGFMLLDVDKFKTVNDTYGHSIGDRVLVRVANLLMQRFRATDSMVRFGGDEFAVIFQEFRAEQTQFVVKKIEDINRELLQPTDDLPPVSLSAGVVFSQAGYTNDLYQKADKALYETKKQGRCGCTVYSDALER